MANTAVPKLDLGDIQGNLLSGYHMKLARHYALAVSDAAGARSLIGAMSRGDPVQAPQVSDSQAWAAHQHPPHAINLGLTHAGLRAIGLSENILALFPPAYRAGPGDASRAASLGDTGDAAPLRWQFGGPHQPAVHLLISVHADAQPELDQVSARLESLFARAHLDVILQLDAQAIRTAESEDGKVSYDRVHFGYRDGISQPRIQGTPATLYRRTPDDPMPLAPAGDFLLGGGHLNSFKGNHLGDLPADLFTNATYGAFRMISQDVPAFERLLRDSARRWNATPEWVAAKLMGRWRTGTPLYLSPDDPQMPATAAPARPDRLGDSPNDFDYGPSATLPHAYDDAIGLRCPVGSHIRRLNPRGSLVMGKPYNRRLVRRGLPYGPVFDPDRQGYEDDGVERGLIGYFLCGDLETQFEFMQRAWVNDDLSAAGLRGTREPITGAHPPEGGRFVIRTRDSRDPITLTDLPRLTWTRGSVYCLLPGIAGLRRLAQLP